MTTEGWIIQQYDDFCCLDMDLDDALGEALNETETDLTQQPARWARELRKYTGEQP